MFDLVVDDSTLEICEETTLGDKENKDVNDIVKSVVNTIRDFSSKIGKMHSKPCPICGDVVTGE